MTPQRVSVIIPAYRASAYIERAIRSALDQTHPPSEVIVVDDCSPDDTAQVVESIGDERVKLLRNERNQGPSYSRNRAMAAATGDWVAVLDADDWWAPERLFVLLELAVRQGADIVCDDLNLIEDGAEQPWCTYLQSRQRVIGTISNDMEIAVNDMIRLDFGYLQPVIRRNLIVEYQLAYQERLNYGEDFRFVLECLLAGGTMFIIPKPMYYYRSATNSLSTHKRASCEAQIRSVDELIVTYSERPEVVKELHKYRGKKSLMLAGLKLDESIRESRFLDAAAELWRHPGIVRSLLRNWYLSLFKKRSKLI
jgi:succinoglycan biosynthesis protein ExoO